MKTKLSERLEEMVENTIIIITNDLPSLLQQEEVYQTRRHHKDQILKNLPEAKAQILQDLEDMAETFDSHEWRNGEDGTVKAVPIENLRKYCEVEK